MARVFGPQKGAGVTVRERQGQQQIEQGELGVNGYTGIMEKGPIGKSFLALNKTQFAFKAGGLISESLLPDAALDLFEDSNGTASLWLNRVTDGNEKTAYEMFLNRRDFRSNTMKILAGNPGGWAGRRREIVDEYDSITVNTMTLTNPPSDLETDELVGALVTFNAVAGKSYEVISNTTAGVITFATDVDLVTDIGTSTDKLVSCKLQNNGKAIGVKVIEGVIDPSTTFGLEVYFISGGVADRVKVFNDMSANPNDPNYFVKVINDDSNADFLIKVEDLMLGGTPDPSLRPSNYYGIVESLTSTTLTAKVHDVEVSAATAGMKAELSSTDLGANVITDKVALTCTAGGTRSSGTATFAVNPSDGDTILVNGKTLTYKTIVLDAETEILIGSNAEETVDNTVAFINASEAVEIENVLFAEKASASTMGLFAATAGSAGNSLTTAAGSGSNPPTWGAATLTGGVDQTWSYVSEQMPFLTGLTVTSGVAFTKPNEYGFGFTLIDTTFDSTKVYQVGDIINLYMRPFKAGELEGGELVANTDEPRIVYTIVSNTADQITVRSGSEMTDNADVGDKFLVRYIQQLGGGYDGIAEISDIDYVNAYDTATSPLRSLRGKDQGLVKLATPGITATAVQKAGAAFAASQNWQYRYAIPANIIDEQALDEYVAVTLGRNNYAVLTWPTFAYVLDRQGSGNKLIDCSGMFHGKEAKIANAYEGYHKAAAGDGTELTKIVALPDGMEEKIIDQEFTNPRGYNIIKRSAGQYVMWGDRTVGTDTQFKFKHQREQLSYYENVFLENFDFIIWKINDELTDKSASAAFIQFFTPELAKRALRGDQLLDDALVLKIDSEINTDATRGDGDLYAQLGLRLADTVERFIITISKLGITEG